MDKDEVFVPYKAINEGTNIDPYLPKILRKDSATNTQAFPIAIEPPYTNRRILAQQGGFTVHGTKDEPIDVQFDKNGSDRITKIKFAKEHVAKLRDDLASVVITIDSIYQDLNSLSKKLIEHKYVK